MSIQSKIYSSIFALVIAVSASSCGSPQRNVLATPPLQPTESFPMDSPVPSPVPTITATELLPTETPSTSTPALNVVTVTAANGNIFIRRGPDVAFNPVSVLKKGMSAVALARDPLARWLEVPLPDQKDKTGWISIQTTYSTVTGNVEELPSKAPTEWPIAGYLRNCTFHEMIVKPGDTTIPSLKEYPENEVWINPGSYAVYDTEVSGDQEVMKIDMREGIEIEVRVDGNGEKHKCP